MTATLRQDVELLRALHLVERLGETAPRRPEHANTESAARRLAGWRSQSPFESDHWFARRCAADGLDPESLGALLAEPADRLASRTSAEVPWADRLERAYAEEPAELPPGERTAFARIVGPLLAQAWRELEARVREILERRPQAPFDTRVVPLLYAGLPTRIDWLLSRSAVLELRIAKLEGRLAGDTPRERFRRFVDELAAPERALELLREYPVLARLVVETLERWVTVSAELLDRLAGDWEDLRCRYSPDRDPGPVVEVSPALGDLHQGGRAVRSLAFASGLRIVYKPRPSAVDVRFAELLEWLRQRGAPRFRTPAVLDRGSYGWAEYLTPAPCESVAEAERFYERQGALLALLHTLNANDVHRSNLIAVGEHPVLLDLESLLGADYGLGEPGSFEILADYDLTSSVWSVMLLPYLKESREGGVIDVSGLGGGEGQTALHDQPTWENRETDEMRLVRRRPKLKAKGNRPTLGDQRLSALDFSDHITAGFTRMYRLLIRHRRALLADASPLRRLAACEVRAIFRASRLYSMILRESYHPDRLRDALDRDRLFDRLWFGIDRTKFPDVALRLIPSERAALWRGDIPYFVARADSRDACDDRGRRLPGLFRRSGLEVVSDRLQGLCDRDLDFQLWVVRSSLTALASGREGVGYRQYPRPPRCEPVSRDKLIDAARDVGRRLAQLARIQNGRASWLGLRTVSDGRSELRPLDLDLYSGLPGIALFFAYLGAVAGDDDCRRLAERAWATSRVRLERRRPQRLGAFDGWGGMLYAAHHLASLWQRPEIVDEALTWLPEIAAEAEGDEELDLVRGAAGCILPLLHLSRLTDAAVPLARRLGDRLVATAQPAEPEGLCWDVAASRGHPLLGLSHGASGLAWALLELFGHTGEETYRATALEAIRFEDGHYHDQEGNWPDRRVGERTVAPTEPVFSTAWCHGATGIGLSRLLMRRHLEGRQAARAERDVEVAFETTLRQGFGINHSLCHGDLGSLDFLFQAAVASGDRGWKETVRRAAEATVAGIDHNGWICGVPTAIETPGLMNGLAGIGYGLLRLAVPDKVPSVLALAPPTEPLPSLNRREERGP